MTPDKRVSSRRESSEPSDNSRNSKIVLLTQRRSRQRFFLLRTGPVRHNRWPDCRPIRKKGGRHDGFDL
jgi:hypothetical protein